jgi:hypothetical protein
MAHEKKLEEISVRKAENGGHSVRHEFKRQPVKREGSMSGGIYNERPPSEEHIFGPDDDGKLAAHIIQHLGLKVGKGASPDE